MPAEGVADHRAFEVLAGLGERPPPFGGDGLPEGGRQGVGADGAVAGSDDGEVGEDVLQQVPELSDLPVIFISAYGRDETLARALESRAADYVVKPFLADGTGGAAPRRAATA